VLALPALREHREVRRLAERFGLVPEQYRR
jgi:hypothetical protein